MFRNKIFNISFLISLLWHLFWISIVTIITVPTGLKLADYSSVIFLGPILKKTAFDLILEESPIRFETMYMCPVIPQYTFEVEIETSEQEFPKSVLEFSKPFMYKSSLRDIIREAKMTAPYFFREISSISLEEFGIESPLEERAVVFKPEKIPEIPMWITQDKESFRIELEFTVTPSGSVEKINPIVSSGYPMVDTIGMDYLKKWRFTPLKPSQEQKNEKGRIEIELKVD